jgi:integrase
VPEDVIESVALGWPLSMLRGLALPVPVLGGSERHRRWEEIMEPVVLLDAAGRRRSAVTMPGHRRGQAPRNKGMRYPADPPSVEEIVLVMRHAGDHAHGLRLRGLIVVIWRAGLRIGEALALTESDLDEARGAILVRHGKGDKRREVGMDQWDGSCCARGLPTASRYRSGRCSASSTGAPAAGR